jgi:hypothetical protein
MDEGHGSASAGQYQTGRKAMFQSEDSYDERVKRCHF